MISGEKENALGGEEKGDGRRLAARQKGCLKSRVRRSSNTVMRKVMTSKKVDASILKMPSKEGCVSELQAGLTIDPGVQSSPEERDDSHNLKCHHEIKTRTSQLDRFPDFKETILWAAVWPAGPDTTREVGLKE